MSTAAAATRVRPRSQTKLILFAIFFAVTAFVTYMKNARIFDPASEIARHFAPATLFLIPHAFFAGLAMIMGAFQFSNRLRSRYLRVHRVMGYIYVVSVMIGAPIAIPLAARIDTASLVAASVVQAFGWMFCTGVALYCIRSGNVQQHRRWMIRGYPFAMVFTVARLIVPIPAILRSGFVGIEIVVWTTIRDGRFPAQRYSGLAVDRASARKSSGSVGLQRRGIRVDRSCPRASCRPRRTAPVTNY